MQWSVVQLAKQKSLVKTFPNSSSGTFLTPNSYCTTWQQFPAEEIQSRWSCTCMRLVSGHHSGISSRWRREGPRCAVRGDPSPSRLRTNQMQLFKIQIVCEEKPWTQTASKPNQTIVALTTENPRAKEAFQRSTTTTTTSTVWSPEPRFFLLQ